LELKWRNNRNVKTITKQKFSHISLISKYYQRDNMKEIRRTDFEARLRK